MQSLTKEIWLNSLWKNNPALVQLLGLCPLLATSTSGATALGLGMATVLVMVLSNTVISLIKDFIPHEIRIPIFVVIIASLVTLIQLLINGFAYSLYLSLGIFLPLIVTNCIVIGRIEAFAYKNRVGVAALDGLAMGIGMSIALVTLGLVREALGSGTLFKGLDLIFGEVAQSWYITLYSTDSNFILATLAPGAFLCLGCLIALKNYISKRAKLRTLRNLAQTSQAAAKLSHTAVDYTANL